MIFIFSGSFTGTNNNLQTGTNVTPIQKQEEISPDDIPF